VVQEFPELGKLQRDYKPAPAVLKNTGHAIMVSQTTTTWVLLGSPFTNSKEIKIDFEVSDY